ncbi:MAG: hypothetical protein QOF21_1644, partial [Actinomycetota bacterium]
MFRERASLLHQNRRVRVAIVHDYLTQRGGAERVVLSMLKAFPDAPLYTSVYEPSGTFPEFADVDVRTSPLNAIAPLRRDPRRAIGLLAPTFSRMRVDADVTFCSSSGWAHGCATTGVKVVYCHNPARWLYQADDYLGEQPRRAARLALALLRSRLMRWDRAAAATAAVYLTQSRVVQGRIETAYGRKAELLPAPVGLDEGGSRTPVNGVAAGYFLCVSRLQPYKNVGAVVDAFRGLDQDLVVVGDGPERARLEEQLPPNVTLLGAVTDEHLRWLYANCTGVVAASYEDYGLTPLEALRFGRPSAVLRYGGFLDTVCEGETGV